jgi:hypothetical protein
VTTNTATTPAPETFDAPSANTEQQLEDALFGSTVRSALSLWRRTPRLHRDHSGP